ncbi:MAG: class I SAM-dependent methyltransferase [Candidatus Actinomarina sp.]|nr:class I SAM-dependent methyltransferase [Candidatus Actinomarina sp.]
MKKYLFFIISNFLLFFIFPIIRLLSKKFYEKRILPHLINMTCSSKPIQIQKKKIIPNAYGKVLEIGFGSGVNLKLYNGENVEKIYGIDPSQELHVLAYENAKSVAISIDLQIGSAEELPFEDNSFDTVVSTYSLCSIPNPEIALNEISRVLKSSGKFYFAEHGLSSDTRVANFQNFIEFFYPKISGGCHVNRDILKLINNSELELKVSQSMYLPGTQKFLGFNSWGTAG